MAKFCISCAYVRPLGLAADTPLTRMPDRLDVDAREGLRIERRRTRAVADVLVGRRVPLAHAGGRTPAGGILGRTVTDLRNGVVVRTAVDGERIDEFALLRAGARDRAVRVVVPCGDRRHCVAAGGDEAVGTAIAAARGAVGVCGELVCGRRRCAPAPDRVRVARRQIDRAAAVRTRVVIVPIDVDGGPRRHARGVRPLARKIRAIGLLSRGIGDRAIVEGFVIVGAADRRVVLTELESEHSETRCLRHK